MNTARSLKLIRERFSTCAESAPGMFRAEMRYDGKPRGIFFFDFSEVPASPGFDLSAYLQKYLAPDFYQNEGSIQWNYYLYFILEKSNFRVVEASGLAKKIELERTFARKFVRDEDWFVQDLSGNLSSTLFKGDKPKDIASHWVEELNKAGLGKIADLNTPYTTIVDDFIKARATEPVVARIPTSEESVPNGQFLKSLEIKAFRKHPLTTTYDFGQVNLIRGVNGSGKTSLLEAIELGICGGIRRQSGKSPTKAALLLTFVGDGQPVKAPLTDPAHYRTIDAAWYGGYYRKVNKLCENFGRFNFFDADAGFRLSHGESAAAIREAIEALFLGEYANSLESIMQRCLSGFEIKQREINQRLASLGSEQSKLEADLATVKRIKNTAETLSAELNAKANATGWLKIPGKLGQSELVSLSESIEDIRLDLNTSLENIHWLPELSLKTLNEESFKLKTGIKDWNEKINEIEKLSKALEKLGQTIIFLSAKTILLTRVIAYHSEEDGLKLLGIQAAISTKKSEYETLREVNGLVKDIDFAPYKDVPRTIADILDTADAVITAKRRVLFQKHKRIESLKKQSSEIVALVEQIKGMGKHLCEQNPGQKDCPLCGTVYESGLLEQIDKFKPDKSFEKSLRQLTAEAAAEEKDLQQVQEGKAIVEHIQRAASRLISESQLASKTMKFISTLLAGSRDRTAKVKSELDSLQTLERRLKLRGFTERELVSMLEEGEESFNLSRTQATKIAAVNTILEKEQRALEAAKREQKALEASIKMLHADVSTLAKNALGNSKVEEPSVEMKRRLVIIQNGISISKKAKENLVFLNEAKFSSLADRLKSFNEAVSRIRELLRQIEEKDALEKKWDEALITAKSSISLQKTRRERVGEALDVLKRLLNSENKQTYLSSMLKGQREKLASLFRQIHSPQEFDEVKINGDIFLNRRDGGVAQLTEISTGQRSALALSIFLSMNSSVGMKAPWLIFDDPIVHIDDLNVLSFLDSLRELVITGHRQMFFATASSKVANLFRRKFDFLGESFKEFALERPEV